MTDLSPGDLVTASDSSVVMVIKYPPSMNNQFGEYPRIQCIRYGEVIEGWTTEHRDYFIFPRDWNPSLTKEVLIPRWKPQ